MIARRAILLTLAGLPALRALPAFAASTVRVVATITILADFVRQVGGDRVSVTTLVGPNGDAHTYDPSPAEAREIAAAQLIVANGLGLEGWMTRLVASAGAKAPLVIASKGVAEIEGAGDEKGKADPHAWQSVANAKIYVANIRDALIAVDPADKERYASNAAAYLARLDALDEEVRASIAKIQPDRRRIITTHDAFGYFAKAYGMTFIAPVGMSTDAQASAKDIARIILQIRAEKIPAVFLENVSDPRLIERIARETGARIGRTVYSDALSPPGGPASSYIDMIRNNVGAFVDALAR